MKAEGGRGEREREGKREGTGDGCGGGEDESQQHGGHLGQAFGMEGERGGALTRSFEGDRGRRR